MKLDSYLLRSYRRGTGSSPGCERQGAAWCFAVLAFALLSMQPGWAQGVTTLLSGQKTPVPSTPADALKRTTPRSAIYGLLEACHENNFRLATQYLDTRKLPANERTEGAERAKDLCRLLDHDPQFEVDQLSN